MKNKKQYTFTLNEELIDWFRNHSTTNGRTMSSLINSYILELKLENEYNPEIKSVSKKGEVDGY
jgi:hypothetical protein